MCFTDPIGDLITRIRNAQNINRLKVKVPYSNLRSAILNVLQREGYIKGYEVSNETPFKKNIEVDLKYTEGKAVIAEIKRISKPGRRVYGNIKELPKVHNGLGISILSTSQGVLSDYEARQKNVGGEILITVF